MAAAARSLLLIVAVAFLLSISLLAVDAGAGDFDMWLTAAGRSSGGGCQGTIGECLAGDGYGDGEFDLDSEIHRRILATSRYISYAALSRNRVPCSRRGASYYNCRAGGQANPYRRGCSAITRCRRS